MRFSLSVSAVLAMAVSVLAAEPTFDFDPVTKPDKNQVINAGSTFEITWDSIAKYDEETISIELIGGATQGTQIPKGVIASGVKNSAGKYSWSVDAALGDDKVYGLTLRSEKNKDLFQYSNPFQIKASDNKPSGSQSGSDTTTVVTMSHGVKTVSLSTSSTPVPTTSSAAPTTSSKVQNTTTTHQTTTMMTMSSSSSAPATDITTEPAVSTTAPSASPSATAGASMARAGTFSVIAGVVVALFVL